MEERPPVWVGHIHLTSARFDESETFLQTLGMRPIAKFENVAILELRGGTHLVLQRGDDTTGGSADFDLMVEDLDATHASFEAKGLAPSAIELGRIHDSFTIDEPGGTRITFNSSHVSDLPV